MKTIYLAGPDVFETDATQQGDRLKEICAKYSFEGHFPLDNTIADYETPYQTAKAIQEANIALIHKCDILIANLNPFRGLEPDSGTVFEVGYAIALGKEVYAYADDCSPMIQRVQEAQGLETTATQCNEGKMIEDFGLSHNLMMIDKVIGTSLEAVLKQL